MKIAFIYSGHLRTWEAIQENHEKNLWTDDCELFFHTYEKPEVKREFKFTQIPVEFYAMDGISHKFNTRKRPEATVAQSLNQWHNMFVSFCLVPLGFDVYVKTRTDLHLGSKIDFSVDYNNKIYIPEHNDFGGINDRFAFGNYETMKKYYSVYVNHLDLWNDGTEFHTETMQLANLNRQGVQIVRVPVEEHILRETI